MNPILIIGSGLAGYMLAKEFRKLDSTTPLTIITASDGHFYSKPLLSTALSQQRNLDNLAVANAETMAKQLNASIHTRVKITHIDSDKSYVHSANKKFPYSKLILALGADIIKPMLTGNAADEIYAVNDLETYASFQQNLSAKKHIAILGSGLVGCEFANDLLNAGHAVEIISLSAYPIDRLLPKAVALVLQQALTASGAKWHLNNQAMVINKHNEKYEITLRDQSKLTADLILSAIGLKPHVQLAMTANLAINRGIIVDRYLQTNIPGIYALGDCAEVNGLVLLFVAPLLNCARALAKTLTGEPTIVAYPAMPIVIKTPACPLVIAPPPQAAEGEWHISGSDNNLKALFYHSPEKLLGFALTGEAVREKMELTKKLPAYF